MVVHIDIGLACLRLDCCMPLCCPLMHVPEAREEEVVLPPLIASNSPSPSTSPHLPHTASLMGLVGGNCSRGSSPLHTPSPRLGWEVMIGEDRRVEGSGRGGSRSPSPRVQHHHHHHRSRSPM